MAKLDLTKYGITGTTETGLGLFLEQLLVGGDVYKRQALGIAAEK